MYLSRYIAVIYMSFLNVSRYGCTQLFVNDSNIIENIPVNLTCASSESSRYSAWNSDRYVFFVASNSTTGKCFTQGDNNIVERCYCYDNNTYIVTILPELYQHGQNWTCNINGVLSNKIVLNVSVPVYNVTLGQPGSSIILREEITTVSCVTSYSRPRANITFYLDDISGSARFYFDEAKNSCSYTTISTSKSLISTNCTMAILMNRTFNGWNLVCTADNINNYKPIASESIKLNVTYMTNKPTIQCTNNGIYKVIENTQGNLTCSVDGGNPAGTLHWNCTGDTTYYRGPQNNVTHILVWNATQSQYCTCTSANRAGNLSTSVKMELLYPPTIGAMKNASVFEGDSVSIQCDVTQANPPVNLIQGTTISNKYNIPDVALTIQNISRTDDTIYTCTAYNTMKPSCRDVVTGNTSKSIHVDVLYPPNIDFPYGKTYTVTAQQTKDVAPTLYRRWTPTLD